jgi:hypothetical protein
MLFGFLKKKSKAPSVDRRKEPRYDAADEFLLEFERKTHYLGHSRDISVHGVRFATTSKMKNKEKVILNFRLPQEFPGTRHFTVKGHVVRVYKPQGASRFRVGCELDHDGEGTKETLRQFIHWLEHRAS